MGFPAQKLVRDDLYSLEKYSEIRPDFRKQVIAHKKNRHLPIGPNLTLYFEDRLTMQYQVQEMLRTEKIFEVDGIEEELAAYNPLIPDGCNWKATMMIEFTNADERATALTKMLGIEDRVWVQVADFDRVFAIADEDMDRSSDEKTSAVHFMRFELSAAMSGSLQKGAALTAGVDHPVYSHVVESVPDNILKALVADLS